MDSQKKIIRVPKLEGVENYGLWSSEVQGLLERKGLWYVVEHAAIFPTPSAPLPELAKTASDADRKALVVAQAEVDEKREAVVQQIAQIRKAQADAQQCLRHGVRNHLLRHIEGMTDPHEIWQRFRSMYTWASLDRAYDLRQKLTGMRLREGQPVESHLLAVETVVYQLEQCGENISDKELILRVLMSLPPSWRDFGTVIHVTSSFNPLTYDEFYGQIICEEMRRKAYAQHWGISTKPSAANTSTPSGNRKRRGGKRTNNSQNVQTSNNPTCGTRRGCY
jgi:hypothetical protein